MIIQVAEDSTPLLTFRCQRGEHGNKRVDDTTLSNFSCRRMKHANMSHLYVSSSLSSLSLCLISVCVFLFLCLVCRFAVTVASRSLQNGNALMRFFSLTVSLFLSFSLSLCLSDCLSVGLFLSLCLSVSISLSLTVYFSLSPSVCLLCNCLSLYNCLSL